MNISNINRLNNEYRALRNQAEAVYVENGMVHSNEEGLCYQKAANIAGQLASMNIGAESNHWVEEQQKCQQLENHHSREQQARIGTHQVPAHLFNFAAAHIAPPFV